MSISVSNNHVLSCHCGSPLQLDVLSLNRKLLGDTSSKRYCLACMADLFECAVEDVISKLDSFKREGCRLFPAQDKGWKGPGVVDPYSTIKILAVWEAEGAYLTLGISNFSDDRLIDNSGVKKE